MNEEKKQILNSSTGRRLVFFVGGFLLGAFIFGRFSTPAPNLYQTQLQTCQSQLDNMTKWNFTDKGVLEGMMATHNNRTYECDNWTEIYTIGG